jgi:hypothetical protein
MMSHEYENPYQYPYQYSWDGKLFGTSLPRLPISGSVDLIVQSQHHTSITLTKVNAFEQKRSWTWISVDWRIGKNAKIKYWWKKNIKNILGSISITKIF